MIVKVKRQDNKTSTPYYQSFEYNIKGIRTVAGILEDLNYLDDLVDINKKSVRRISYSCSCMQKICGACAMVVNGMPTLACSKFIDTEKTKEIILEPLSKFPVICDLVVDRSIILEYQKNAKMYIEEVGTPDKELQEKEYNIGKCLKCGLCLEVCPNYKKDGTNFYGAQFANTAFLNYALTNNRKEEIKEEYNKYFSSGCSKSMACHSICPMHMTTLSSIAFMNRLNFKKTK